MGDQISISLADDVRAELEEQARMRGVRLSTLLRDLATQAARDARRARIREASGEVAARAPNSEEGRALYDWATET